MIKMNLKILNGLNVLLQFAAGKVFVSSKKVIMVIIKTSFWTIGALSEAATRGVVCKKVFLEIS